MPDRIERDAFLFLEPKTEAGAEDFAQCGPCRMFVPEKFLGGMAGDRCILHGSNVKIDDDDSCGFMAPWPGGSPNTQVMKDHAAELMKVIPGSVDPEESGLVSRRVQCHRCRFADAKASSCGLYATLNDAFPELFDLDPEIEAHSCCNAQMPAVGKVSEDEYAKMSYGEKLNYAKSASIAKRPA